MLSKSWLLLSCAALVACGEWTHSLTSLLKYHDWEILEGKHIGICFLAAGLGAISTVDGCADPVLTQCRFVEFNKIAHEKQYVSQSWTTHMGVIRGYDNESHVVIFYFSGPDPQKDQLTLAELDAQAWADFLPHCGKTARVGQKIYDAWIATRDFVGTTLRNLLMKYKDHHLVLAGHSSGGCLAQMFKLWAINERLWPANLLHTMGYGTPRCGDKVFADALMKTEGVVGRIYRPNDAFMQHPPLPNPTEPSTGYYHAGKLGMMSSENNSISITCNDAEAKCQTGSEETPLNQIESHYYGWPKPELYFDGGHCLWLPDELKNASASGES